MKRILSMPVLLAGGCAAVAFGVLVHDVMAPAPVAAVAPAGADLPPPVVTAAPPPAVDPSVYLEMAARPLFIPSRRPPVVAAGAAAGPVTPALDFALVGVVTGPGQDLALVQQAGQAAAILVHVGSVVDGWTVEKISGAGIRVQAGGTSSTLKIVQ